MTFAAEGSRGGLALMRRLIDRYYLLLMALLALGTLVLNYRACCQGGIFPDFEDLRDVIRSGFDGTQATRRGSLSYPMWGYAWVLLLTGSKPALLLMQNALMLLAAGYWVRVLSRTGTLAAGQLTVLRALLAISVPWFAFHSVKFEGGIAASFMLLGTAFLAESLHGGLVLTGRLLLSALMFGISANFRSDGLLAPLVFSPLLLVVTRFRLRAVIATLVWLGSSIALLIPWGLYTRHVTGHFLLTSTNGGLVSVIGFGTNPGNRWGIAIDDDDPVVRGWLVEHFGRDELPWSVAGDRYLKRRFRQMICESPTEYARRIALVLGEHVVQGIYPGEFYRCLAESPEDSVERYLAMRRQAVHQPLRLVRDEPGQVSIVLLQLASSLMGRGVVLLSFILLPAVAVHAVRRRNVVLLLVLTAIVYRALVLALLAFADGRLTTAAYPFHLVNLVVGLFLVGQVAGRLLRRRRAL